MKKSIFIIILFILFSSFLFSATCIKEWQYVGTPGFSINGGGFVSLYIDDINRYSASPHPQFRIKNKGAGEIDVSKIEIRYWYKYEGKGQKEVAVVDWAGINGNPITSNTNIGIITGSFGNKQDRYIKITFKAGAGNLGNGINDYLEVNTRYNKEDWSVYDQSNDWSYAGNTSYKTWDRVTVYYNSIKVYGKEP